MRTMPKCIMLLVRDFAVYRNMWDDGNGQFKFNSVLSCCACPLFLFINDGAAIPETTG